MEFCFYCPGLLLCKRHSNHKKCEHLLRDHPPGTSYSKVTMRDYYLSLQFQGNEIYYYYAALSHRKHFR
jgi:hypothetical protein